MGGPKGAGQQITHRRVQGFPGHSRPRDGRFRVCKLSQFLAAPTTGRHGAWAVRDHGDFGNPARTGSGHGRNGPGFGTGAFGIGHVFNVAANIYRSAFRPYRRSDFEIRIRR